jgi:hypothetical protein
MTTNRTPLNRSRRAATYANTVGLFRELEKTPMRRRSTTAFKDRVDDLHWRLGLHGEYRFSASSVLDRSDGPVYPPGYVSYEEWFKVRAIREQLLETTGLKAKAPTIAP